MRKVYDFMDICFIFVVGAGVGFIIFLATNVIECREESTSSKLEKWQCVEWGLETIEYREKTSCFNIHQYKALWVSCELCYFELEDSGMVVKSIFGTPEGFIQYCKENMAEKYPVVYEKVCIKEGLNCKEYENKLFCADFRWLDG